MAEARDDLVVSIVDDDAAVRDSLSLLLSLRGYRTATFASAADFLAAWKPQWAGCLFADVRMPGMSGLELQEELARRGAHLAVVIITAHGDVGTARAAFKSDAVDFLEKPFDEDGPAAAAESGLRRARDRIAAARVEERRRASLAALSAREREVLDLLVLGIHNKEVAARLDISPRTVEVHKAHIMAKLDAANLADLIRISQGEGG